MRKDLLMEDSEPGLCLGHQVLGTWSLKLSVEHETTHFGKLLAPIYLFCGSPPKMVDPNDKNANVVSGRGRLRNKLIPLPVLEWYRLCFVVLNQPRFPLLFDRIFCSEHLGTCQMTYIQKWHWEQ